MAEHYKFFCVLGFLIQLLICFRFKKAWIRMMPLFVTMGCMAVNAGLYLANSDLYHLVCMVLWGLILLVSESAWVVYALVKLVKKVKNKFTVSGKNT